MKTSDARELDFDILGEALTSVIGGDLHIYGSDQGLILNREFLTEKHTHFLEITKKYKNNKIVYNIISYEKEKAGEKIYSSFKLQNINNLHVTIPNLILGENRKVSLMTTNANRFIVVDFTDTIGVSIISGIERRGEETEDITHEKRREFVKL